MIDAMLPPLEALTYQIHIPWPSRAVPLGTPPVGSTCACVGAGVAFLGGCSAWA